MNDEKTGSETPLQPTPPEAAPTYTSPAPIEQQPVAITPVEPVLAPVPTPATPAETTIETPEHTEKVGKLKLALLYVLIGGLAISAIISITAILIGEFNSVVTKALLTTLVFVSHSLIVLGIVIADRDDRIGKSLLITVILGAVIANMITASFGIWEVFSAEFTWRAIMMYILLIGAAFLVTSTKQLIIDHAPTRITANVTLVIIGILTFMLGLWIAAPELFESTPFFFRLIGCFAILGMTTLSATTILHRVTISQHPELAETANIEPDFNGALAGIVKLIGIVVLILWIIGGFSLLWAGFAAESSSRHSNYPSQYNQYN